MKESTATPITAITATTARSSEATFCELSRRCPSPLAPVAGTISSPAISAFHAKPHACWTPAM